MTEELELHVVRLNDIAARKWAVSKSGFVTEEHTRSLGGLCRTVKISHRYQLLSDSFTLVCVLQE